MTIYKIIKWEIWFKHDIPGYNSKVGLQKNTSKSTVSGVSFSGISTYNNIYLNWRMCETPQLLT